MSNIHREFDVEIGRLLKQARREGHSVPCAPGCDACCSSIAQAQPVEIVPIIEAVREWEPAQQTTLFARLQAWARTLRQAGVDIRKADPPILPYEKAHAVCPFLVEHRCSIYEVRPIACRGHYLINADPKVCANRVQHPTIPCITVDHIVGPILIEIWNAAYDLNPNAKVLVGVGLFQLLVLSAWKLVNEETPNYEAWVGHVLDGGI